jgi:hypothetical protein
LPGLNWVRGGRPTHSPKSAEIQEPRTSRSLLRATGVTSRHLTVTRLGERSCSNVAPHVAAGGELTSATADFDPQRTSPDSRDSSTRTNCQMSRCDPIGLPPSRCDPIGFPPSRCDPIGFPPLAFYSTCKFGPAACKAVAGCHQRGLFSMISPPPPVVLRRMIEAARKVEGMPPIARRWLANETHLQ